MSTIIEKSDCKKHAGWAVGDHCPHCLVERVKSLEGQLALSLQISETLLPFSDPNEREYISKTRERHRKLHDLFIKEIENENI